MNKYLYFSVIIALLAVSCNQPKSQNENASEAVDDLPDSVKIENALYDDVMAVHDEMMPKMEDMMRIKGKMIEISDSLRETGATDARKPYLDAVILIETADEAMMGWMRAFNPNMDGLSHDERVEYLKDQKAKMDSVKIVMQQALETGGKLAN